jgi:hypothetical protein
VALVVKRAHFALGVLLGLLLGRAAGCAVGVVTSTNWYEYHVLEEREEPADLVNRQHWQPLPDSFGGQRVTFYYRRPRIRLGE